MDTGDIPADVSMRMSMDFDRKTIDRLKEENKTLLDLLEVIINNNDVVEGRKQAEGLIWESKSPLREIEKQIRSAKYFLSQAIEERDERLQERMELAILYEKNRYLRITGTEWKDD